MSESSSGVGGAGAATPGRKRSKARRRKPSRRRVSRVAPAEPEARAEAAAKAIRERAAETEADPLNDPQDTPGSGTGEAGDPETDAPAVSPEELQAFADASEPVIRVGLKGLALALRGRFPSAADRIAQAAPVYASRLAGTVGLRLAGLLGAKIGIAAIVAEFAEAFIDDRLAVRPGEG